MSKSSLRRRGLIRAAVGTRVLSGPRTAPKLPAHGVLRANAPGVLIAVFVASAFAVRRHPLIARAHPLAVDLRSLGVVPQPAAPCRRIGLAAVTAAISRPVRGLLLELTARECPA